MLPPGSEQLLGRRNAKLEKPCVSRYQQSGPKCAGVCRREGTMTMVCLFWEVGRWRERPSVADRGFMMWGSSFAAGAWLAGVLMGG